jgi:hypothetical protein
MPDLVEVGWIAFLKLVAGVPDLVEVGCFAPLLTC